MVTFEALNAEHGDCLMIHFTDAEGTRRLWLIDGGPSPVFRDRLSKRIDELRGGQPLRLDLAMVSHIDDDHINGILALLRQQVRLVKDERKPGTVDIREFWFNGFEQIVGAPPVTGGVGPAGGTGDLAVELGLTEEFQVGVTASVGQGNDLLADLRSLRVPVNTRSEPLVVAPRHLRDVSGAEVTVLGPLQSRLDALRKKWEAAARKPKKARKAELTDLFRTDLDTSVPNLSSIVALVEIQGKRILLTGDARGDDIVAGWKAAFPERQEPCPIDILKMPHHGSDRGITEAFLRLFPATHYVISANGRDGNPEPAVLEQIAVTQAGRDFTIHLTNDLPHVREKIEQLRQQRGARFRYEARGATDPGAPSVTITL
jgi:hypothetical protein